MKSLSKLHLPSVVLGLLVAACVSCAGDYAGDGKKAPASGSLAQKLEAAVGQAPETLRPARAPGLTEAKWGSNFAYVTPDGRYVIFGDMLDLDTREEVTEGLRRGDRLEALAEFGAENTIEFAPASNGAARHTVTVFTDIDCGYCRMLHRQMEQYHEQGIAIRYVFFPRSGPGTDSFRKAQAVWCAEDRRAALTQAKASGDYAGSGDCPNPIQRGWDLAIKLGVRGTPLIVLPDGDTVPGYVPADQLMARLSGSSARQAAAVN